MSTQEVNDWMAKYDNPMKPVVQRVREIIMARRRAHGRDH